MNPVLSYVSILQVRTEGGGGRTPVASAAANIKFDAPGTTHTHVGTIPRHSRHAGWCVAADNDADTDPTCAWQTGDASTATHATPKLVHAQGQTFTHRPFAQSPLSSLAIDSAGR